MKVCWGRQEDENPSIKLFSGSPCLSSKKALLNPMSILNLALRSTILTVAYMGVSNNFFPEIVGLLRSEHPREGPQIAKKQPCSYHTTYCHIILY